MKCNVNLDLLIDIVLEWMYGVVSGVPHFFFDVDILLFLQASRDGCLYLISANW